MSPIVENTLCTWVNPVKLGSCSALARHTNFKNLTSGRKSFISCSYNVEKEFRVPLDVNLANAKVIYSVASATAHNKLGHPESNLRVPAIVSTLESMELTPKFRSTEIIELKHFKPASVEDISSVHERAYVLGLEKVTMFEFALNLFEFQFIIGEIENITQKVYKFCKMFSSG